MRVAVVGPLEVEGEGGRLAIGGRRERALLTLLAVRAPRAATMSEIVDGLWGEDPPRSAHKAVQTAIVNLRHKVPANVIVTTADGYRLDIPASDVDMHRFEDLIAKSRLMAGRQQILEAEALLVEALALWRGDPLGDLSGTMTGRAEATRLSELKLLAEEESVDLALAQGRHSHVIAQLNTAVTAAPLRERRWAQLMLALYRSGRQADALRTYRRLREVLGAELGIEPSPELVALEEAILVQKPEIGWSPRDVPTGSPVGVSRPGLDLPDGIAEFRGRSFVGRRTELEELTARWRQAIGGQRQSVFLVGEPGIGKSALVSVLADRVIADGGLVLYGRGDEELRAPYQLIADAVRGVLRSDAQSPLPIGPLSGELTRLLPELAAGRPDLPAPTQADPATEQYLLFRAVTELFASLTRRAPALLVLDDLHWADRSTLPMVRHLIGSSGSLRLMVIATLRNNDPEALAATMTDLSGIWQQSGTYRIQLAGLGLDEIGELLALGSWASSPGVTTAVAAGELHRSTNGNPFFVSQILQTWSDRNESGPAHPASGPVVSRVPSAVQEVIRTRVSRLPESVQMTLSAAAVVGSVVPLELLRRLAEAGASTDLVLNSVDVATASGLLTERAAGQFAFAHDLVREYLYAGLGPARRMRLHLSVARALESLSGDGEVEALAYHYAMAAPLGMGAFAADFAIRAWRRSLQQAALEQGVAQLVRAEQALDGDPSVSASTRAGLLLALAGACDAAGDNEGNRQRCLSAARHARAAGTADQLAAAAVQAAAPGFAGQPDKRVLELCDEALRVSDSLSVPLRAQLLATVAYYRSSRDGCNSAHDEMSGAAVELSRLTEDTSVHAFVLFMRFRTIIGTERSEERVALARELMGLPTLAGWSDVGPTRASGYWQRPYALLCEAVAALEQGERDRFETSLSELETLALAPNSLLRSLAVILRGTSLLMDGRFEDADDNLSSISAVVSADARLQASYQAQLIRIRFEQGRIEELLPMLVDAAASAAGDPVVLTVLAFVQAASGNPDDAARTMASARGGGFDRLPHTITWTFVVATAVETCVALRHEKWCRELYDLLEPRAGLQLVAAWGVACLGAADRYLAMLASVCGEPSQTVAHFHTALAAERRLRAQALSVRTQSWQVRYLDSRQEQTEREQQPQAVVQRHERFR